MRLTLIWIAFMFAILIQDTIVFYSGMELVDPPQAMKTFFNIVLILATIGDCADIFSKLRGDK